MIADLWARLAKLLAPVLMPVLLGLLALCAGGWAWQTVRINGFQLWFVKIHGLRAERDDAVKGRADDHASYVAAQEIARQKAEQARAATEASYKALADQKDKEYATEIADARSAADAYIASHRVQPQAAQGASSRSVAGATSDGAGLRQDLPAAGIVVSEADVHACTEVTGYALKLREWALSLPQVSSNP